MRKTPFVFFCGGETKVDVSLSISSFLLIWINGVVIFAVFL